MRRACDCCHCWNRPDLHRLPSAVIHTAGQRLCNPPPDERFGPEDHRSGASVNLRAVINIEDVENTVVLLDAVNDATSAAPCPMKASEWLRYGFGRSLRLRRHTN